MPAPDRGPRSKRAGPQEGLPKGSSHLGTKGTGGADAHGPHFLLRFCRRHRPGNTHMAPPALPSSFQETTESPRAEAVWGRGRHPRHLFSVDSINVVCV